MRLSKFTVSVPDYPTPQETLLFNTFTQSMVVVEEPLRTILKRLPSTEGADGRTLEYLGALEECGIVVGDKVDENRILRHWFDQLKYSRTVFEAIILTTYDCNFQCSYCVEEGVKRKLPMTPEVCRKTSEWLAERLEEAHPKRLRVSFYGGEPLLNGPAIQVISKLLSAVAERQGVVFESSIVTNGSLLRKNMVKELVPYGLKQVKVTLDGDRQAHDRKRPFKGGRGSFDVILHNVCEVADEVRVNIGGNFDRENVRSLPGLLDTLKDLDLEGKLGWVDFKPIMGTLHSLESPAGRRSLCGSFSDGDLPKSSYI